MADQVRPIMKAPHIIARSRLYRWAGYLAAGNIIVFRLEEFGLADERDKWMINVRLDGAKRPYNA